MKRTSIPLIVVAVLLALPFWAIVLLPLPVRALDALGVQAPVLYGLLAAPHFGAVQALGAGLPWGESGMEIALRWFAGDGPHDDVGLVAPRATSYFRQDLATLAMLRREGLAA